jgi:hypothetical protein
MNAMEVRLIIGVTALASSPACGLAANLASWDMIDQVNQKLPWEQRFDWLFWYWSKHQRLFREYKRLYPTGRLRKRIWTLYGVSIACFLICVGVLVCTVGRPQAG